MHITGNKTLGGGAQFDNIWNQVFNGWDLLEIIDLHLVLVFMFQMS